MPFGIELRTLRGQVHQPAWYGLAVKRGRGAFDNIHALDEPRIDLQHIVTAAVAHKAHAVEENIIHVAAVKTAQRQRVKARRAAADVGEHTRRIVKRLRKCACALIFHLLTRDDGNRLRGGDKRLIGFGRTCAGFHHIAFGRRGGRLRGGGANGDGLFGERDVGCRQRQRAQHGGAFQG